MSFPALLTRRLRLRPLEPRDATHLSHYRSDPEVARYQGWRAPYTQTQALELIAEMQHRTLSDTGWTQLGVADLSTDALLGDIGWRRFAPQHAEIGFTLSTQVQGQGIMREALEALLSLGFEQLEVHRVIANTDARNLRSQGLLQRLGFRLEGVHLESWLEGETWFDEHSYALLRREWKALP